MERESFEDEEVAAYLNKYFIAIKVDKEERPDIDSIYMDICVNLTGSGGWPLSIFMMADQKPFFAGTYFSKESSSYRIGFLDLLRAIRTRWDDDRGTLKDISSQIAKTLEDNAKSTKNNKGIKDIDNSLIHLAGKTLISHFDRENGGFGRAPKFPTPHNIMFLLRYSILHSSDKGIYAVEKTLDSMYLGGLFDHIGYGFSRYSTDREWLVPHFEKMLYDNGLLLIAYLEAYQFRKNDVYKEIAIRTIKYLFREMADEEGGFYSAQDADSEGVEGKYYVFTPKEIVRLLGKEDGLEFNKYYDITERGNFEGANIPNRLHMDGKTDHEFLDEKIKALSKKVYDYRLLRMKLHKDDKILTSWNGIMIAALSYSYRVLREEEYLVRAKKAEEFIYQKLNKDGILMVHYREGSGSGKGYADDYAYYIYGLLHLYEASFEIQYLKRALEFHRIFVEQFFDEEEGGFYLYSKESEELIHRPKVVYDGAIPSGNSIALYNLVKLSRYIGITELIEIKDKHIKFMAKAIGKYPSGCMFAMMSGILEVHGTRELICILDGEEDVKKLKELLSHLFLPNLLVVVKTKENKEEIEELLPFIKEYSRNKKTPVFYLCENYSCKAPVYNFNKLEKLLIDLT